MDFSTVLSIIALSFSLPAAVFSIVVFWRDHERSRRMNTIDLLIYWSTNVNQKSSLARKYVEELDYKQSVKLNRQEEIRFNKEDKDLYKMIKELLKDDNLCDDKKEEKKGKSYTLTRAESAKLRWYVISYLNLFETVFLAWRHHIVDKKMIAEQFSYLLNVEEGREFLKEFRRATGGYNSYPSVEAFIEELKKEKKPKIRGKRRL
jgi:hypothetical protein